MKSTVIKIVDRYTPCSVNYFVVNGLAKKKREWIKTHELYEAKTNMGDRIVTPVTIINGFEALDKVYMMDAITGSIYDIETGKCLTSHEIYMEDFVYKPNLHKKLMAISTYIHRGVL